MGNEVKQQLDTNAHRAESIRLIKKYFDIRIKEVTDSNLAEGLAGSARQQEMAFKSGYLKACNDAYKFVKDLQL
jgi:hypothetical protein